MALKNVFLTILWKCPSCGGTERTVKDAIDVYHKHNGILYNLERLGEDE